MCRFIDEKILVIGSYPAGSTNYDFMELLSSNLKKDLGDEYKIIRLQNGKPEEIETEGLSSAVGNHMNFLRLGNKILFPYYSDEISQEPLKAFQKNINQLGLNIEVIAVGITEIRDLARFGSVLNCISWQV